MAFTDYAHLRIRLSQNDSLYLNSKMTMRQTIFEKLKLYKNIQNNLNNDNLKELEPENDVCPSCCGEDLTFDRFLNEQTVKKNSCVG